MSVNCSYLYTSSGLRFEEGQLTVDLSGRERPDGRGVFPDGSLLRVVRNGHGRSRLDRFGAEALERDGAVGEISLKDLRTMGVVDIPVTVHTPHGAFDHLTLNPAAAQGRAARQAGVESGGGASAYDGLNPGQQAALAATQIESLPYGKVTEASSQRLSMALAYSPSLKNAFKRNPEAWRHLDPDAVYGLALGRPEEMLEVIRWSIQPTLDPYGQFNDPDPHQAVAVLYAATVLDIQFTQVNPSLGSLYGNRGSAISGLTASELSPYLARALRHEIAGTPSGGPSGDGRLLALASALVSQEAGSLFGTTQPDVLNGVRDVVANAALAMAADRDDFRSGWVRNRGVDLLAEVNARYGYPLPPTYGQARSLGLEGEDVGRYLTLQALATARVASTFEELVNEFTGLHQTADTYLAALASNGNTSEGELPRRADLLTYNAGKSDAMDYAQARRAGWSPEQIGAVVGALTRNGAGDVRWLANWGVPLHQAAEWARSGMLPEQALKSIENGYRTADVGRKAPIVHRSLAGFLADHDLKMAVLDQDGNERPLVTTPDDLARIPRSASANDDPWVKGEVSAYAATVRGDSGRRVRFTHPASGGELELDELQFACLVHDRVTSSGLRTINDVLEHRFPGDLSGTEVDNRVFASWLLASRVRSAYQTAIQESDGPILEEVARAAGHVYETEVVDPRDVAELKRWTLHRPLFGVEVTVPEAAELCTAGHIDPQHSGGDATRSATKEAFERFHPGDRKTPGEAYVDWSKGPVTGNQSQLQPNTPPAFDTVLTLGPRPDVDSLAAASLVALAGLGINLGESDTVRSVVAAIDRSDRTNTDPWDGAAVAARNGGNNRSADELTVDDPEVIGALGMLMSDFKVNPQDRITVMASHLLQATREDEGGNRPSDKVLEAVKQRRVNRETAVTESTVITYGGDGADGIAVVASKHPFAMGIGYERHPVAVAFNPEFPNREGQPYRKFTIGRYNSTIPLDTTALVAALNAAEVAAGNPAVQRRVDGSFSGGWGGSTDIVGSPQGADSYLDSGTVAQIVNAHRR